MGRKFDPAVISLINPQKRFRSLKENTEGRDFVVGDIHGVFDLLDQALLAAKFNPEKDRLISLGDLLNRGPDSVATLKFLKKRWFYPIMGNNELLFLEAYRDKKINHTLITNDKKLEWMLSSRKEDLDKLYDKISELPFAMEVETSKGLHAFVHANIPQPDKKPAKWKAFKRKIIHGDIQTIYATVTDSSRARNPGKFQRISGVFRAFAGHTPLSNGPVKDHNSFFIDTGAVLKLIGRENSGAMHLTLVEIRAVAKDICNPQPVKNNPMVKVALAAKV